MTCHFLINWKFGRIPRCGPCVSNLKVSSELLGVFLVSNQKVALHFPGWFLCQTERLLCPEARGRIHWWPPGGIWSLTCVADFQIATNRGDPRVQQLGFHTRSFRQMPYMSLFLHSVYCTTLRPSCINWQFQCNVSFVNPFCFLCFMFDIVNLSLVSSLQSCDHLLWKGWPLAL